jgi:hypothetical protein
MPRRTQALYAPPSLNWDTDKVPRSWRRLRTWDNMDNFHALPKSERRVQYYTDNTEIKTEEVFTGGRVYNIQANTSYWWPGLEPGTFHWRFGDLNSSARSLLASTDFNVESQNLQTELKLDLATKLGDMKTHLGVVLAEARKTHDMIESAATRLWLSYRAFRGGRFKDVATILNLKPRTVHSTWLEYRYGWLPFMRDVEGQAELLAQQCGLGGRPPRFSVRSKVGSISGEKHTNTTYTTWGGQSTANYQEHLTYKQRMYLKAKIEMANSHLAALQQTGITNPALLVWEVIPYSFVFDWFISVGQYCQALTAFDGLSVVDKMLNSEVDVSFRHDEPATSTSDGVTAYSLGALNRAFSIRSYLREPSFQLSVPFDELSVRNPFPDWKKMITGLALTRTQTSRLETQPYRRKMVLKPFH